MKNDIKTFRYPKIIAIILLLFYLKSIEILKKPGADAGYQNLLAIGYHLDGHRPEDAPKSTKTVYVSTVNQWLTDNEKQR